MTLIVKSYQMVTVRKVRWRAVVRALKRRADERRDFSGLPVILLRSNFALANHHLPAIIWGFASGTCLRRCTTVDVSVWVVRYRAFVVAAPGCFVAGNSPAKCGEPFSFGAMFSAWAAIEATSCAL